MQMLKRALQWLMAVLYVFAGIMHFANTDFYVRIMPDYLPMHTELVYLSGLIEIMLGILLIVPSATRWAAWGIIALLIAVFPANIHMAVHRIPMQAGAPPPSDLLLWLRLPLQGVLIAWAWWYTVPTTRRRERLQLP